MNIGGNRAALMLLEVNKPNAAGAASARRLRLSTDGVIRLTVFLGMLILIGSLLLSVISLTRTCRKYHQDKAELIQQVADLSAERAELQTSLAKAKQSVAFWQMVATQPPTPDASIPSITCPEEEVSDEEVLAYVAEQFGPSEESSPGR